MSKNEGNQKLKFFKPSDLARNAPCIFTPMFVNSMIVINDKLMTTDLTEKL